MLLIFACLLTITTEYIELKSQGTDIVIYAVPSSIVEILGSINNSALKRHPINLQQWADSDMLTLNGGFILTTKSGKRILVRGKSLYVDEKEIDSLSIRIDANGNITIL
jgi:hypothetical protein